MPSPLLLLLLCTTSCCCSLTIRNFQILRPTDQFLLLRMLWTSSLKYQLATQIGSQICKQCGIDFMYFIASQLLHTSVSAYTNSSTIQTHCNIYCWIQYNTLYDILDGGVGRYLVSISTIPTLSQLRSVPSSYQHWSKLNSFESNFPVESSCVVHTRLPFSMDPILATTIQNNYHIIMMIMIVMAWVLRMGIPSVCCPTWLIRPHYHDNCAHLHR